MNARTNKALSIGLGVILLVFVFLVKFTESGPRLASDEPSIADFGDSGRRAAIALLEQVGFRAEAWQSPPSSLPRGSATLILPVAPRTLFGGESEEGAVTSPLAEELDRPSRLDLHLPINYRRFLDEGGVLFASAEDETLEFLIGDLELAALEDLVLEDVGGGDLGRTEIPGSDPLEIEWQRKFLLEADSPVSVWASRGSDSPHVVTLAVGQGELVLFSDQSVLSNLWLLDGDEGYLLVRAIVEFDRSGLILFDEYALGRWNPQTSRELAFSGRFLQPTVLWLALLLIFVWRLSWVGRFPRDPEPLALLSPLARVRSQAHLIERARRYELLARWLVDGMLGRAMKSWRMKRAEEGADRSVEELKALATRAQLDVAKWRSRLLEKKVTSPRQLKALEDSLIEFEREVTRSHSGRVHGKLKQRS